MAKGKQITQKEFNDTVRSNIEDLCMDVDEAIEDAVALFKDMGLSYLICHSPFIANARSIKYKTSLLRR